MIKQISKFLNERKSINIISGKHTYNMAVILRDALVDLGYDCKIYDSVPLFSWSDLYIVFSPQTYRFLPKNYIVYQVEQMTYSHHNNRKYISILKKAIAIFDYSYTNIDILKKDKIIKDKIYFLPFSINKNRLKTEPTISNKRYDVLFYGDDSSVRRKKLLSALSSRFDVKICNNLFGNEMESVIKDSLIVINIHYLEDAILETCRLSEILSLNNNLVISEAGIDEVLNDKYKNIIEIVDAGNCNQMISVIDYYLHNPNYVYSKILNNKELLLRESSFEKYILEYFGENKLC